MVIGRRMTRAIRLDIHEREVVHLAHNVNILGLLCYQGIGGVMTTLAMAIPTEPAAIANSTYATVSAPRSSVCLPLELRGFPSSPIVTRSSSNGFGITTLSLPVPKEAPTAMRLQNSTVAHRKGIIPMINTSFELSDISIGGERFHPGSPTYDCSCRVQLSDWNVFLPDLFQGIRYLSR